MIVPAVSYFINILVNRALQDIPIGASLSSPILIPFKSGAPSAYMIAPGFFQFIFYQFAVFVCELAFFDPRLPRR